MIGVSAEEMNQIEKQVQRMMMSKYEKKEELISFLDLPTSKGGVELDKRRAKVLGEKIDQVLEEIRILQKEDRLLKEGLRRDVTQEVVKARTYLLDTFDVHLRKKQQLDAINYAISRRLKNQLDREQLYQLLDAPVKKGGVGLDRRLARKMAKHFEMIMLGKYNA